MEYIFAAGPLLFVKQNAQQRFWTIEPKFLASFFLHHMDALPVKVGPLHFDDVTAALASIVNAHANELEMPRTSGIERYNHLVRPNQMAFAVMLVMALDPNCRVSPTLALELGEALGVFPDIGDHGN